MSNIALIITIVGTVGTISGVVVAWVVARKQGTFNRSALKMSLFDLAEGKYTSSEVVIAGPHSKHNILTPVLVQITNHGTATSYSIEVTVESDSNAVVNHPVFYISPIATSSTEPIEGKIHHLGNGEFRRVFKIPELNPGKSVQLNNAGPPGNFLRKGESVAYSLLKVTIYEREKTARTCKFGVWSLDTSQRSFRDALSLMSGKLKTEYKERSKYQRFLMRLRHKHHEHQLLLMDITDLRAVPISEESRSFSTANKVDVSYGMRFVTGQIFSGPEGLI